MKTGRLGPRVTLLAVLAFFTIATLPEAAENAANAASTSAPSSRYTFSKRPHPDGIGKIFEGREISHVMGHQGADWLERPEREIEERPDLLMPLLNLKPGQHVADIGAGTGYFARRMAKAVGPRGVVHAVEIQQEMLNLLLDGAKKAGITNIAPVLGTIEDPRLPKAAIDLVLMVDVYHEFSHPYEMLDRICFAVKPGGRVVFVEYRAEDPTVPIKALHKMSEAQVRREAALHPLTWVTTHTNLPRQHVIVFQRK